MEIYGRRNSTNVIPVLWTLEELGQSYRRHDVGGVFGGTDTPAFRSLNPNGRVPVLDDDGFVLFESNAIVRYLADAYGEGTLRLADPRDRAQADQWMEWHKTTFYPSFIALYQSFIRTEPEQRDARRIAELASSVGELLHIPDRALRERAYLGGAAFGIGDIPLGTMMYRYFSLPVERPALPGLEAWYGRLCAREPYRSCAMQPFGLTPAEFKALERAGGAEP